MLVLGLKEYLIECATVCVKSEVIPLKANGNVSLSGAWLAGSAMTDFKSVMNKMLVGETQDVHFDLMVKIEDFIVKVIHTA